LTHPHTGPSSLPKEVSSSETHTRRLCNNRSRISMKRIERYATCDGLRYERTLLCGHARLFIIVRISGTKTSQSARSSAVFHRGRIQPNEWTRGQSYLLPSYALGVRRSGYGLPERCSIQLLTEECLACTSKTVFRSATTSLSPIALHSIEHVHFMRYLREKQTKTKNTCWFTYFRVRCTVRHVLELGGLAPAQWRTCDTPQRRSTGHRGSPACALHPPFDALCNASGDSAL